jgi:hypothetical protein
MWCIVHEIAFGLATHICQVCLFLDARDHKLDQLADILVCKSHFQMRYACWYKQASKYVSGILILLGFSQMLVEIERKLFARIGRTRALSVASLNIINWWNRTWAIIPVRCFITICCKPSLSHRSSLSRLIVNIGGIVVRCTQEVSVIGIDAWCTLTLFPVVVQNDWCNRYEVSS